MNEIKVGDKISIDVPDVRWRVRVWCWVMRRPRPMVRRVFTVTRHIQVP